MNSSKFISKCDGSREQLERAVFFLQEAKANSSDPKKNFRFLMAGVYAARAIIEIELEDCPDKDLTKAMFSRNIAFCDLIYRLRIHDFHRHALTPPNPKFRRQGKLGPIKLTTRKRGWTGIVWTGITTIIKGKNFSIKEDRPIEFVDDKFKDPASGEFQSLEHVLERNLESIQQNIIFPESDFFTRVLTRPT